jgi:hypothetical protein
LIGNALLFRTATTRRPLPPVVAAVGVEDAMTENDAVLLMGQLYQVLTKIDTIYKLDIPREQKITHLDKIITPTDMQTVGRAGCLILRCKTCTGYLLAAPITIKGMEKGGTPYCALCGSGDKPTMNQLHDSIRDSVKSMVGAAQRPQQQRQQVITQTIVRQAPRRRPNPDNQFMGHTRKEFRENGIISGLVFSPITVVEDGFNALLGWDDD